MAFSAYPSHGILYKICFLMIPIVLLGLMIAMAVDEHVINTRLHRDHSSGDFSTRNFLILMIASMAPLIVVEKKLMELADPIGAISKFTPKIFVMHTALLVVRLLTGFIYGAHSRFFMIRNIVFLIGAGLLVPTFFKGRLTRADLLAHFDVLLLVTVSCATAVFTEYFDAYNHGMYANHHWAPRWYRNRLNLYIFSSCSDYIELLAFMPAMWLVCRGSKSASAGEPNLAEAKRRSRFLFLFIIPFYGFEDLHSAIALGWGFKFAAAGHLLHLLLILGFGAHILSHLFASPTSASEKPSLLKEDVEVSSANENLEV